MSYVVVEEVEELPASSEHHSETPPPEQNLLPDGVDRDTFDWCSGELTRLAGVLQDSAGIEDPWGSLQMPAADRQSLIGRGEYKLEANIGWGQENLRTLAGVVSKYSTADIRREVAEQLLLRQLARDLE